MMASPNSELSLECNPQSYSMLLKSVGEQQTDQTHQKLQEFLSRLEDERLKIDAFKRELPLCMQLLTNAMEASRKQLHSYQANEGPKLVLEEFISLKQPNSEGISVKNITNNIASDKANWMTSAQLWSQAAGGGDDHHQLSPATSPKESDVGFVNANLKHGFENIQRSGLPELALASSPDHHKEMEDKKIIIINSESDMMMRRESSCRVMINNNCVMEQEAKKTIADNTQTHRKARRCWSPDLHRRFVNALHMLGGSQVATPKQIRELMKVDGLTNDEVKSHLQKYRLHTRRPSPSQQTAAAGAPQLVVLGGIWVPPEYAAAHHGGVSAALYGGHHPTIHHPSPHYYATGPVPQEFYAAPTPPQAAAAHHHQLHHQIQVYQPASQTQSSPESDVRGGTDDRSESIEDGKSESSSWKGDSNCDQNGGERKGLVLREEGEESNGSEITLKF